MGVGGGPGGGGLDSKSDVNKYSHIAWFKLQGI